jgi:hypothetical protein
VSTPLSVRPPDLVDYQEARIVTLSPRSSALRRAALAAGGVAAAMIVAGAIYGSGHRVQDLPSWWWAFIALGWLCLSVLVGAGLWTVLASREPWFCADCGARLRKRETTDTHPRLGALDATIFVCRRCRKFEAHLGTSPTSWS